MLTIREEPPPSAPLAAGAWPSLSSGGGAAFPASERPVALFDGSTLNGWAGKIDRYFFAENGSIVARNNPADPLGPSTALLSERSFRNFRLVFEQRLVVSEMHSGGERTLGSLLSLAGFAVAPTTDASSQCISGGSSTRTRRRVSRSSRTPTRGTWRSSLALMLRREIGAFLISVRPAFSAAADSLDPAFR